MKFTENSQTIRNVSFKKMSMQTAIFQIVTADKQNKGTDKKEKGGVYKAPPSQLFYAVAE